METEQDLVVKALETALKMEEEGKKYYRKSIEQCSSKLSKDLLIWLADEEDKHKHKFKKIYDSIAGKQGWPVFDLNENSNAWLKTTFRESVRASKPISECKTDIYIMEKAMELENQSHNFYADRSNKASYKTEKAFYSSIAGEEMSHYLALVDYREYLIDPASYFVKTERHSLDGA